MKLTGIVRQLRNERDRVQAEVDRLDAALTALGGLDSTERVRAGGRKRRRHLSPAARHSSLAQKRRWRNQRQLLEAISAPAHKTRARVHWTQLPQNRARVLQTAKKMTRARMAA